MQDINKVFDYDRMSKEYGVDPSKLDEFINEAKAEFKNDEMMVELHVIRAIRFYNIKRVARMVQH